MYPNVGFRDAMSRWRPMRLGYARGPFPAVRYIAIKPVESTLNGRSRWVSEGS